MIENTSDNDGIIIKTIEDTDTDNIIIEELEDTEDNGQDDYQLPIP